MGMRPLGPGPARLRPWARLEPTANGPTRDGLMAHSPQAATGPRAEKLAKEKVLPGSGVGFLDLFSTPSLGETEFQQGVKFRVAQEGELARLISTINVVKSAKVALAIPQKTIFSDSFLYLF